MSSGWSVILTPNIVTSQRHTLEHNLIAFLSPLFCRLWCEHRWVFLLGGFVLLTLLIVAKPGPTTPPYTHRRRSCPLHPVRIVCFPFFLFLSNYRLVYWWPCFYDRTDSGPHWAESFGSFKGVTFVLACKPCIFLIKLKVSRPCLFCLHSLSALRPSMLQRIRFVASSFSRLSKTII